MAKQVKFEGQLPLMGSVVVTEDSQKIVPIEFGSKIESELFSQSLMEVVPEEMRSNSEVKQSIEVIYSTYQGVYTSTRQLAVAVYKFCKLTGATYEKVATKISKGSQDQLNRSYVGQLYHAGFALSCSEACHKLNDIAKLNLIGKLTDTQIRETVSLDSGQVKIGGKLVAFMSRESFKDLLSDLFPQTFTESSEKKWSIVSFRAQVSEAIEANSADSFLTQTLESVLSQLDVKIAAANAAEAARKAAKAEAEKAEKAANKAKREADKAAKAAAKQAKAS